MQNSNGSTLATLLKNSLAEMDCVFTKSTKGLTGNLQFCEFSKVRDAVKDLTQLYDRYWLCAFLVSIFEEEPWLESITIDVSVESEYNDEGGYYDYTRVHVSDSCAVDGSAIPLEYAFEEGVDQDDGFGVEEGESLEEASASTLDSDAFNESLSERLSDYGAEFNDALNLSSGVEKSITLNRSEFEDLLLAPVNGTVSGKAVYERLAHIFD